MEFTYQGDRAFIGKQVTQAGSFADQLFLANHIGRSTIDSISKPFTLYCVKTAGYSRHVNTKAVCFHYGFSNKANLSLTTSKF